MIYALLALIIVLAALDGGGLAALLILPMSVAFLVFIAGVIGAFMGMPDSDTLILGSMAVFFGCLLIGYVAVWIGEQLRRN